MSSYPGENSDIGKRLIEGLETQPLVFLVPKDNLGSVLSEPLDMDPKLFDLPQSKPLKDIKNTEEYGNLKMSFNFPLEEKIVYKRPEFPKFIEKTEADDFGKGSAAERMLNALSPLARKFFEDNDPLLTSDDLLHSDIIPASSELHSEKRGRYDSAEVPVDTSSILDLNEEEEHQVKKSKVDTSTSVNQNSIGEQYIRDLALLLNILTNDDAVSKSNNSDVWIEISESKYVLTSQYLIKLKSVFKSLTNFPQLWSSITSTDLHKLLDTLIQNIEFISAALVTEQNKNNLKKIGYSSVSLIFLTLLITKQDQNLYLERYILTPIEFLQHSLGRIKASDTDDPEIIEEVVYLQETVISLPEYLEKIPFIDEGLLSKLVYMLTDTLLKNETDLFTGWEQRHSWELIKNISINSLVTLFIKVKNQRDFIINELLSHIDETPQKRIQKNLRRVDKTTYVSDFIITLIQMLETVNSYDFYKELEVINKENIDLVCEYASEQEHALQTIIDQVTEFIMGKIIDNPTKYKYIIDNYTTDLITLSRLPQWSIAENLLSSLTKKLILCFDPDQNSNSALQSLCLQILGNVGALIFEIKSSDICDPNMSVSELREKPDKLELFLAYSKACYNSINRAQGDKYSKEYFWQKTINTLLKLRPRYNESEECLEESELSKKQKFDTIIERIFMDDNYLENSSIQQDGTPNISQMYCFILNCSSLQELYGPYLKIVVSSLDKEKIKLRSTALKNLSMLATIDESILVTPLVRNTIQQRFSDSSAMVKDSILDLLSIGNAALHFYKPINENFNDESLMVRRHVLKLNEQIYDKALDPKLKIFVASHILQKIEDEESSITDLAKAILFNKWIKELKNSVNNAELENTKATEIIDILAGVCSSSEKCSDLFDWFLNFFLLNEEIQGIDNFNIIISCLNRISDILVQQVTALQFQPTSTDDKKLHQLSILKLLTEFSNCMVPFLTRDHIVSLSPYISDTNNSPFQYYLLRIFNNTLNKDPNFKINFLYDLETTLISRLPKSSPKEIDEAIPLLWTIASQRRDYARLEKACASCFKLLGPYINLANKTNKSLSVDGKLQRLIYLGTGFAASCHFTSDSKNLYSLQKEGSVHEYMTKCLLVFLQDKAPYALQRVSLKCLLHLCSKRSQLFNSKYILNILDREFNSTKKELQLIVLEGLYHFFFTEKEVMARNAGLNSINSSKYQIKEKSFKLQSAHDGICSSLVSRFIPKILECCRGTDPARALVSMKLIKLILKDGYANPSTCIPSIICVTVSTFKELKGLALEILAEEIDKYDTIVFNNLAKGIIMAEQLNKSIGGKNYYKTTEFLYEVQCLLNENKKHNILFIKRIVRLLNTSFNNLIIGACSKQAMELTIFVCSNVARLKFETQYDLLDILKEIGYTSEHMRTSILEKLPFNDKTDEIEETKNALKVQLFLDGITTILNETYGIKEDVILMGYKEEAEMKEKVISANCSVQGELIVKCIESVSAFCEKSDAFEEYADKYKYLD